MLQDPFYNVLDAAMGFLKRFVPAPKRVAIDHDDYHASHVGRLRDGGQFFLTEPFFPCSDGRVRAFVARYLFDADGTLLDAEIRDLGFRDELDPEKGRTELEGLFAGLQHPSFERISVRPFRVRHDEIEFGLILNRPESEDGIDASWSVSAMPGDYMAFYPPFNSGDYDT